LLLPLVLKGYGSRLLDQREREKERKRERDPKGNDFGGGEKKGTVLFIMLQGNNVLSS
jgi:hypothetical protein